MGPKGYDRVQKAMDEADIPVRTLLADQVGADSDSLPPRSKQGAFNVEFVTIRPLDDGVTPAFVLDALSKANLLGALGAPIETSDEPSLDRVPGDSLTFRDLNYPASQ